MNNTVNKHPIATIEINQYGTIVIELYPEEAPETVASFISLANSGFYDGLTFHRVIAGFMIQGGDPKGNGTGGPGYSIKGEFAANGVANGISHVPGVISMGRTQVFDSAGSQFFICVADCTYLDGQYAAFGKAISGVEVAVAISETKTNFYDMPLAPVVIGQIRVETNGEDYSHFTKLPER